MLISKPDSASNFHKHKRCDIQFITYSPLPVMHSKWNIYIKWRTDLLLMWRQLLGSFKLCVYKVAIGWVSGYFSDSPSHNDAHLIETLQCFLSVSLSHTHIKRLQTFSLTTANLSACPSRQDPHQLLRFPQKPKTTLNVRVCVSMIMTEDPKGKPWKSNTFCCRLSSSHLASELIFHFNSPCISLFNCVNVLFKTGGNWKKKQLMPGDVKVNNCLLWYFQLTTQALKPVGVLKASFGFEKQHKV